MSQKQPGILTAPQREFISCDRDERMEKYSRQDRYQYRARIRSRLRAAMTDFRYLLRLSDADEFPTDELSPVFAPEEDDKVDATTRLPSALEFLAHAQDLDDEQLYPALDTQPALEEFTDAVEKGVERYAADKKRAVVNVSVDVSVDDAIPPEKAIDELESGAPDGQQAARYASLLERAGVDSDRVGNAFEQWGEKNDDGNGGG